MTLYVNNCLLTWVFISRLSLYISLYLYIIVSMFLSIGGGGFLGAFDTVRGPCGRHVARCHCRRHATVARYEEEYTVNFNFFFYFFYFVVFFFSFYIVLFIARWWFVYLPSNLYPTRLRIRSNLHPDPSPRPRRFDTPAIVLSYLQSPTPFTAAKSEATTNILLIIITIIPVILTILIF